MAEYASMHDVDAFLVNPLMAKDANYVYSQPLNKSGDLIPIFLGDEVLTVRTGRKSVESTGKSQKLTSDWVFSHGYASEEEAASPVEDNDFGFHSTDDAESSPSIRESESFEELAKNYHSVQLCTKAQAVKYFSAGKPKIVSVPVSPTRSYASSASNQAIGTAISAPARVVPITKYAYERSPRSSSDKSPASSSYEEPIVRPKTIRRKPNLPPLRAVTAPSTARTNRNQTPLADQRAQFPSFSQLETPASAPLSKRKVPKLSPSFSFNPFGRSHRSSSSASSSTDEGRLDWWNAPSSSASSTSGQQVARNFSRPTAKPMARMTPRGASERAAPLILPPCPDDYNDDSDPLFSPQWPARKDSVTFPPDAETVSAIKQIRRKSLSAAYATART